MATLDGKLEGQEFREEGELDHQELMYLQNLSRADLIALIEDERRASRKRRRNSAMEEDMEEDTEEDKDDLIESLRSELEESDRRNQELESVIRQLQYDLDSRRSSSVYSHSPRSSPIMPRRSRTPASSMSSGISGLGLTTIDTRTSIATTSSSISIGETDALGKLQTLNSTVMRTASSLSKRIRYNDLLLSIPDRKSIDGVDQSFTRATWLVGERIANALYSHPVPKNAAERDPPILLGQIVFEAVFAKWAAFILGHSDDTIEEEGDDKRTWRLSLCSLESTPVNSEKWFASIMSCVHDIMMIAGWSFKKSSSTEPKIPLTPVISAIQGLRKALEDVSNTMHNISVYAVSPGSVFNPAPEMMIDAFSSGKRSIFGIKKKPSPSDRVVATTGLGLQSRMEPLAPQTPPLAPPRVALERTFQDAFFSSSEAEEPQVRIRVGGGRSAAIAPVKVRAIGN